MKKSLINIHYFLIGILLFTSCQEDAELTTLRSVSFNEKPQLSTTELILNESENDNEILRIDWESVDFHIGAPVTYGIQFTTTLDSIGWQQAISLEVGVDVYSKSFTVEEMNTIALDLGLEPNVSHSLSVRVYAFVNRNVYSSSSAFNLTPYLIFTSYPSLWVPGDYQGWNPSTAPKLVSVHDNGIYEGYIFIPEGGTREFKLAAQPEWEPMAYGDGGEGQLIEANFAGANFSVPESGYYLFLVNLNDMRFELIKTDWGIIGGATPGGWDDDTALTFNPDDQIWTAQVAMVSAGSFKFRANRAWQIDFGIDQNGDPAYANHPWLPYIDQPQFTVPENGTYNITLNLSEPGNYQVSIVRN